MRFTIRMNVHEGSKAGAMPSVPFQTEHRKDSKELVKAVVLLATDGVRPMSQAAGDKFSMREAAVIDGPFPETKQ